MDNCGPKVLDILFKIKNEIDPSLTFRRSCAHGLWLMCDEYRWSKYFALLNLILILMELINIPYAFESS